MKLSIVKTHAGGFLWDVFAIWGIVSAGIIVLGFFFGMPVLEVRQ